MSYADDVFIKMCQDILENGTSTEGEKVRPVCGSSGQNNLPVQERLPDCKI